MSQSGGKKNKSSAVPAYLATFAATLLVFCGGTEIGWSSPAILMYEDADIRTPFLPTNDEESWIGSLLTIGALIGALPAGKLADIIGRKPTLMIIAIPVLVAWVIIYFAQTVIWVCAARLIGGVGLGAMGTVVPMYVSEIAEDHNRGKLCAFFELMICIGVLFTYVMGAYASYRIMALACVVPPLIFLIAFTMAPETPMYFLKTKQPARAEESLRILRGESYDTSEELNALEGALKRPTASIKDFFIAMRSKEAILASIMSFGLMCFQQGSGINVITFYSSKIFKAAGANLDNQMCTVYLGIAQVIANAISMFLVEKLGRKLILQISSAITTVSLGVLGYYFMMKDNGDDVTSWRLIPVLSVIVFIFVFEFSWGPIPWTMSGEVLPENIKGIIFGLAVCVSWGLAFVSMSAFLFLVDKIGNANTYWLMSTVTAASCLFSTFVLIETKGKSFQRIQNELAGKWQKN